MLFINSNNWQTLQATDQHAARVLEDLLTALLAARVLTPASLPAAAMAWYNNRLSARQAAVGDVAVWPTPISPIIPINSTLISTGV